MSNKLSVEDLDLSVMELSNQAVKSYIASRMLIATTYLAPAGLYQAHLSIECLLKALIAQAGKQYKLHHNLPELNKDLINISDDKDLCNTEYEEILNWLDPYQELGRYGALAQEKNDPDRKVNNDFIARGITVCQPAFDVHRIDCVFSLLRGKLKNQNDVIDRIINKQEVVGWGFCVPVEDVLLSQNDYYKLNDSAVSPI